MLFGSVFIDPAFDIILFTFIAYGGVYILYAYIFKKDIHRMASTDLKWSLALITIVFGYYYHSEVTVKVLSYDISPLLFFLIVSTLVEIACMIIYMSYFKITFKHFLDEK